MADSEWVPLEIHQYVSRLVNGDASDRYGWASALQDAEADLKTAALQLRLHPKDGDRDVQKELGRQLSQLKIHVAHIERNIAAARRLTTDDRMMEAYGLLAGDFSEAWQWTSFASAAWAAEMDYRPFRERSKKAKDHSRTISRLAIEIADALDKNHGISWPSGFADVAALLRNTDNHDMKDHNFAMWRIMRRHVLGDLPRSVTADPISGGDGNPQVVRKIVEPSDMGQREPAEELRINIRYTWGVAPSLSALLRTLAKEAAQFEPMEFGAIAAATGNRQHNRKNEYVRAFSCILRERQIPLTPTVQKAIAITATVMLGDPDIVVSYDDVRKALGI